MHARAIHGVRVAAMLATIVACAVAAPEAQAVRLTGTIDIRDGDGGAGSLGFNCDGENPCRGQYVIVSRSPGCGKDDFLTDSFVVTGLDLSRAGPVSGTITFAAVDGPGPCSTQPRPRSDIAIPFTGTWNGTSAALAFPPIPDGASVTTLTGAATLVSQLVEINGSLSGSDGAQGTFSCQGTSPCTGTASTTIRDPGCSNAFSVSDQFAMLGLDLSTPGPISGALVLRNLDRSSSVGPNGSCTYTANAARDGGARFTGTWNGTTGVFQLQTEDSSQISGSFTLTTRPLSTVLPPPVFPMTVTTSITATTASATAAIQFRPQDVGTTGSVYAFAIAPQTQVRAASNAEAPFILGKSKPANGAKDTPVACVLAQLNASGQLQAASFASLQAFISGTLSAAGQSVPVIGGVPTGNVAGSTFYVGYGSNSNSMISGGINRSVVTVPGSQVCQPQAPETGWWWNASESGRGYTIEVAGRNIFFSAYLYDASGRSTWHIAAGPTSLDGSLFAGNLESYSNGQTLSGAYRAPTLPPTIAGSLLLAFNTAREGTLTWPGGTVAIRRFEFGTGGVNAVAQPNQPENGWYWNASEGGRGFFIEWQAGTAFMAGFMYEADGHPVWYISAAGTPNARAYSGNWEQYANGQTLTGTYRRPDLANPAVAPVTIRFQGAQDGFMTLPGGREIPLTRQRF